MMSLATITAGLAATTLPSLPFANAFLDSHKTRQATPRSCDENTVLCPGCDGGNFTDQHDVLWAVSCDYAIDANEEVQVGGEVSTGSCLDACDDNKDCVGVTFAPNGSCIIAGGVLGLTYSPGYTILERLETLTTPSASLASITATTRAGISSTTSGLPASPIYSGTSTECSLDDGDLCPKCSGSVVDDSNGKPYRILCDTSLESNGSYSPQEWLSPEECLQECDQHDFCTGVTYFGERSCELAKANPDTTHDTSFTAFLALMEPTISSAAHIPTSRASAWNMSLAAPVAGPTASTLPINTGCNASAVTCDECDGYQITDKLNASYSAVCGREPMCLTTDQRGEATQEECLQKCDQDVACLAVMWSPDSLFCNLCLRGMELSRVAGALPYVLLAADLDGHEATATSTSSAKPTLTITLPTTVSASPARSITNLPAPFSTGQALRRLSPVIAPTRSNLTSIPTSTVSSSSTLAASNSSPFPTSLVVCPESDNHVYFGLGARDTFAVGCNARFEAAHSRFTSASAFEACAALCTAYCDGVQFGATSRCGLYTDITFIGGAPGWTAAARVTVPAATGLPASVTLLDVSAIVGASMRLSSSPSTSTIYAAQVTSDFVTSRRSNFTAPLRSPSVTRASPGPYSLV